VIKNNDFMEKKIKILHVIPRYVIGGAEKLVWHYAKLLDKNKYEIYIASCVEDGEFRKQFENLANVHIYMGSKSGAGGRIGAYLKLWKHTQQIKPDIIHTHLLSADFFGFFVKLIWRKKIFWITTMHNVEGATSLWRKLGWCFILRKVDKALAVSKSVEKFIKKYFAIKDEKCVLLLNGIDTEKWLQVPTNKLFTHKKIQIACIGRFWEQKGQIYLLQALSKVKNFDYELHFFGDGPLKESLISKSKEFKIFEKIVWHGAISNVVDYIADIDIVVQPSLWEGLSLVVMEMMTAGRPIVTTPPAGDELLKDKESGYIVPVKDAQKLVEAIDHIVANQQEAIEIAQEAREYASKNFDIINNVLDLQSIYNNLVHN